MEVDFRPYVKEEDWRNEEFNRSILKLLEEGWILIEKSAGLLIIYKKYEIENFFVYEYADSVPSIFGLLLNAKIFNSYEKAKKYLDEKYETK